MMSCDTRHSKFVYLQSNYLNSSFVALGCLPIEIQSTNTIGFIHLSLTKTEDFRITIHPLKFSMHKYIYANTSLSFHLSSMPMMLCFSRWYLTNIFFTSFSALLFSVYLLTISLMHNVYFYFSLALFSDIYKAEQTIIISLMKGLEIFLSFQYLPAYESEAYYTPVN